MPNLMLNPRKISALLLSICLLSPAVSLADDEYLPLKDTVDPSFETNAASNFYKETNSAYSIKMGGKEIAVLTTEEEAEAALLGVKLSYYDDLATVEKVDFDPMLTVAKQEPNGPVAIKSAEEATDSISDQVSAVYQETKAKEKPIKHEVEEKADYSLAVGEKVVEKKGKDGKLFTLNYTTTINGQDRDTLLASRVIEESSKEVVRVGTKVSTKDKQQAIISYAKKFLGNPYVWGGESLTNGCDCSGYTMQLYRHFGIILPHYSDSQAAYGDKIDSVDEAQAGDLFIYPGHIALYEGNGTIIHAANPSAGIIESSTTEKHYGSPREIRRLFGSEDDTSTNSDFLEYVKEVTK